MVQEINRIKLPSRREIIIGWILTVIFLAAYLSLPNIKYPNGDVHGWAGELEEFATMDGNLFYPTETRATAPRAENVPLEVTDRLGRLVSEAGWWAIWNPHHLMFVPTNAVLFRITRSFLPDINSWMFLRLWNGLASAGTLYLMYLLIIRLFPRTPYAIPWFLFLGSSVTFFRYATDGSQYSIPMFLLAITVGSIHAFTVTNDGKYLVRTGWWFATGILFHQIVSLMAIFILIGIAILIHSRIRKGENVRWREFFIMTALTIGIPVVAYLIIIGSALSSVGELSFVNIFKYTTLYAQGDKYWTGGGIQGFFTNLGTFIGFFYDNQRTFGLLFLNPFFTALVAVLPAFWVTAVLNLKKLTPINRWWLYLCLLWIAPLLVFLSFWVPGHEFYHLLLTIPLGLMVIIGAESARHGGKKGWGDIGVFWAWCIISIIVNYKLALIGVQFGSG